MLPGADKIDSFELRIFDVNGVLYPSTYNFTFPCPLNENNDPVCTQVTEVILI